MTNNDASHTQFHKEYGKVSANLHKTIGKFAVVQKEMRELNVKCHGMEGKIK